VASRTGETMCPLPSASSRIRNRDQTMSALFDFRSFVCVVLLTICSSAYVKSKFPALLSQRTGFRGVFWKFARIGERLSLWVSLACLGMAVSILFY